MLKYISKFDEVKKVNNSAERFRSLSGSTIDRYICSFREGKEQTLQILRWKNPIHFIESAKKLVHVFEDASSKDKEENMQAYSTCGIGSTFEEGFPRYRNNKQGGLDNILRSDSSEDYKRKYEECLSELLEMDQVHDLLTKASSMKKRRIYCEDGDEFNHDRILCGDPMYYEKMTKGKKVAILRLLLNVKITESERDEDLVQLAAVVAACVFVIEQAGFSCEVDYARLKTRPVQDFNYSGTLMNVKQAHEKFYPSMLLFLQKAMFTTGANWINEMCCSDSAASWGFGGAIEFSTLQLIANDLQYDKVISYVSGLEQEPVQIVQDIITNLTEKHL
jgi:hypothetical protein